MFASTQGLIEWCDEERGEKEEISCLEGGREKSFIETVGSHCSSRVGRGKEWGGAHLAGKWNVARGAILPSRIFPTPSSMLHESDSPRI